MRNHMKNHLKKWTALLLAGVMSMALTACGSENTQPSGKDTDAGQETQTGAPADAGQDTAKAGNGETIEFWTTWVPGGDIEAGSLDMIEKFEAETGYKVNYTVYTYDMLHDKVISAASAGNPPDLIWGLPEWLGEFHNMGILEDLTPYYEKWEDKDAVYESVLSALQIQDHYYAVPHEMTLRALEVHKDLNAKAGVEVPKTWEDVLALTDYYEKAGVYPYGIAAAGVRSPQELIVYLAQYGLEVCTIQDDGKYKNTWAENPEDLAKAAKVFQFYKDLVDKGVVDPASVTWGYEETDENFATGYTGMYVTGNWLEEREKSNPETMGDVDICPIPYPSDGQPATYIEAKPQYIFSDSKNKEGAFALASAVCSKEWQEAAFASHSARKDVFTDTIWSKGFANLADDGVVFPPVTLGGITQAMIDSIAMVLQDGKSPEDAASWLSEAINQSLADSGELSE
ncbi:ABC transporter substrate-binding protein [Diplocloster agilis]|nr:MULTISPECIES: sugar ABC transporter substrate-binding protein [Lachnospiraceae]MCU6735083.1 sugar ABC transporter substrate-binding protein [Suonthocola fibrivorans]SCJ63667.1 Maltodextrin-binding protein [uncultured Clostridium sp.]